MYPGLLVALVTASAIDFGLAIGCEITQTRPLLRLAQHRRDISSKIIIVKTQGTCQRQRL